MMRRIFDYVAEVVDEGADVGGKHMWATPFFIILVVPLFMACLIVGLLRRAWLHICNAGRQG